MPSVSILDSEMHYLDVGAGAPIVFLHGNPTSSRLWRRVIAALDGPGRKLAPDLIGMGDSGRPPIEYRLGDHVRYLDAWFEAMDLHGVVLVGHDWGGALAFDWSVRHSGLVRGVAFMETIVRPLSWDGFVGPTQELFKSYRTPGVGEDLVLDQNVLLERALPGTVMSGLSEQDHAAYKAAHPTPETRKPLLQWARELPIDGEPADVTAVVERYDEWLAASRDVPKLLVAFKPGPGQMIGADVVAWCSDNIAALETARCGPAGHHAPEDQPEAIASAIASWTDRHGLRSER